MIAAIVIVSVAAVIIAAIAGAVAYKWVTRKATRELDLEKRDAEWVAKFEALEARCYRTERALSQLGESTANRLADKTNPLGSRFAAR